MSQLPAEVPAAISFLEEVAIQGMMQAAIAFQFWLGWPGVKQIFQAILEHIVVKPAGTEAEKLVIAKMYVMDEAAFSASFIKMKMLDQQGAGVEEKKNGLEIARAAFAKFIRRGPVAP